jgi:hypothetical protein
MIPFPAVFLSHGEVVEKSIYSASLSSFPHLITIIHKPFPTSDYLPRPTLITVISLANVNNVNKKAQTNLKSVA